MSSRPRCHVTVSVCCAYAPWLPEKMAEGNAEGEVDWSGRQSLLFDEDTFFAMEGLQATLQQLEAELRQQDISEESSTEYCNNFCQALMHYAGNRNSVEHGLPLLEVYCLSINCFAAARPHLTGDSPNVALVLKRLALSCLELLLSVPQNEIPLEAWLQFYGSVQAAHEAMLQYGSTDLHALLNITSEGGAWNNPVMVSLLTDQPTDPDKVNAYIALEGEDFMEMRIKHLEKVGELEKALILNKACANCSLLPNQPSFLQTFVTQLCLQLPSEEAILEISRIDAKDVLDLICNLDAEGDENTAFILCTTYFTQQLQQDSIYCSWELTLLWSKLQRRIDVSLESFIERCLQFGAIARTIYNLFFLVRVIQTEAGLLGLAVSVELCVKALRLPKQDDVDAKTMICKAVVCLLPDDLEVARACQLTEFLLNPSQERFDHLEELYSRPDEKYDEENAIIPNSLRCELLLSLKAHWLIDPEFWDWKTLKRYCIRLLGLGKGKEVEATMCNLGAVLSKEKRTRGEESDLEVSRCTEQTADKTKEKDSQEASKKSARHYEDTFFCQMCCKNVTMTLFSLHVRKHMEDGVWRCPVCKQKFKTKKDFEEHSKKHLRISMNDHCKKRKVKKVDSRRDSFLEDSSDELEPGQIPLDPSLAKYYQSTHDPVVLEHILQQAASVPEKQEEHDFITFDYINTHFKLQDRDVYQCPATDCQKNFKLFKYLGVHIKNDHDSEDANLKHYLKMKDCREKCNFCRKTFVTSYHHRQHRWIHYGEQPYICLVTGCGARFDTTNELIAHRHTHGHHLCYGCELKDCSFSYCDLWELYHHEAQHFRDAAYTCTSPGCKNFYYSRKEFIQHLATHGITFTEKDFEAQRKAKMKNLLSVVESDSGSKEGAETGGSKSSSRLSVKSKPLDTCVAVCFDGEKFTCGLKRCGRIFTTISELQKHLKMSHPNMFNEEDLVCKKKAQSNHCKSQTNKVLERNQENVQSSSPPVEKPVQETIVEATKSSKELEEALSSIVLGLRQLSLNNYNTKLCNSRNALTPTSKKRSAKVVSNKSHVVQKELKCFPTEPESPQKPKQSLKDLEKERRESKSLEKPFNCEAKSCIYRTDTSCSLMQHYKKSHGYSEEKLKEMKLVQPKALVAVKSESTDVSVLEDGQLNSKFLVESMKKPFVCDEQNCEYRSVTSEALMKHYTRIHNYTKDKVEEIKSFQAETFKPFECHICSRNFRSKKQLVYHCTRIHHLKGFVEKMKSPFKREPVEPLISSSKISNGKKARSLKEDVKPPKKQLEIWVRKVDGNNGQLKVKKEMETLSETNSIEKNKKIDVRGSPRNIVTRNHKPFNCVHKLCSAAFNNQNALVAHLQMVHRYNRSQLCFPCEHKGCEKQYNHLSRLTEHYQKHHKSKKKDQERKVAAKQSSTSKSSTKRTMALPEEPIPRFKCTFANCNESYHLKSSLLRHTSVVHQSATPPNPASNSTNSKQVLRRHSIASDFPVLRLQSTPKKDDLKHGCQTKLIVSSSAQSKKSQTQTAKHPLKSCCKVDKTACSDDSFESIEETSEEELDKALNPKIQKSSSELSIFRTHEEALQMCQDRCLPIAYPCMLQNCDSVVASIKSLIRHYVSVHKVTRHRLDQHRDKLCFTAEKLEEIIQNKSAIPDLERKPNGVFKMNYQSEPATPGASSLTMNIHSIKNKEAGSFSGDMLPDGSLLIKAEDLLNGSLKSSGQPVSEESSTHKEESQLTAPPLIRPPPLDLSPPPTLRFAVIGSAKELSFKDGKSIQIPSAVSISVPSQTRQPLRRKNQFPEPPSPFSPILKDSVGQSLASHAFDIAAYKPMGFESSFLKFIKDKEEEVKCENSWEEVVSSPCLKPDQLCQQGCFRRNCSVKENSQRGVRLSQSRRIRPSSLKQLVSIQNLRLILKRALGGCGDQAIKQLQFLKPVVVLERPKSFTSIFNFLPSNTKAEASSRH
ncbi:hypothetical protein DNTS_035356 [Danionella cerebrum]|uniref:C2H2-type domain-containing protein n=1 Tax=Danionella cerebrum TaxID=2873325 RepID=A0A553Q1H8_9TELE|nr:hypothetical protein DNTS_035356 [Danionella translucida]